MNINLEGICYKIFTFEAFNLFDRDIGRIAGLLPLDVLSRFRIGDFELEFAVWVASELLNVKQLGIAPRLVNGHIVNQIEERFIESVVSILEIVPKQRFPDGFC